MDQTRSVVETVHRSRPLVDGRVKHSLGTQGPYKPPDGTDVPNPTRHLIGLNSLQERTRICVYRYDDDGKG